MHAHNRWNRLVNREGLLFVAIVAAALTWSLRQHVAIDTTSAVASRSASYGRMCAPSLPADARIAADTRKARATPADCDLRTNVRATRSTRIWV